MEDWDKVLQTEINARYFRGENVAYKITPLFGNITAKKDLDVVIDNKLNMSQQFQTAASRKNKGLGYIRRRMISKTHVM